jgi:hypothetical protein
MRAATRTVRLGGVLAVVAPPFVTIVVELVMELRTLGERANLPTPRLHRRSSNTLRLTGTNDRWCFSWFGG